MFEDGDKISIEVGNVGTTLEGVLVMDYGNYYIVHNNAHYSGCSPQRTNMRGYEYGWQLTDRGRGLRESGGDWRNLRHRTPKPSYSGSILKFKMV
jgi:Rps23 Pro-64 3,4-dihydroxylase Tpa1-like proline 4-hydroxylase